jgi:hypothetical protein
MAREKSLREGLLEMEPLDAERQRRFRQEAAEILEPRLPRAYRWYYVGGFIGCVVGAAGSALAVASNAEHRWMEAGILAVWLLGAGWMGHIVKRGAEPLRAMQGLSKALAGLGMVGAALLIGRGLNEPTTVNVIWGLMGLLLFGVTWGINLWNRVILAERTTREQVLRVEYRVAELAERVGQRGA